MRTNNTRVTRSDQARAESAAKRRAKRKAAREKLLAPLRSKLAAQDKYIVELMNQHAKPVLPVTEETK